jgi:hypothetical protein
MIAAAAGHSERWRILRSPTIKLVRVYKSTETVIVLSKPILGVGVAVPATRRAPMLEDVRTRVQYG